MKEGRGSYSEALKRYVVDEVERGKMNQVEANERYGILGHSTILKWQRRYGKAAGGKTRMMRTNAMTEQEIELIRLRKENEALKRDLADERFKNIVWETMVEVAERELKIPIRKKYGAKRSVRKGRRRARSVKSVDCLARAARLITKRRSGADGMRRMRKRY